MNRPRHLRRSIAALAGAIPVLLTTSVVGTLADERSAIDSGRQVAAQAEQAYLLRDAYFLELRDAISETGDGDAVYVNTPGMHWIPEAGCGTDAPENNQILCALRDARDRGTMVRISVGADITRPTSSEYARAVKQFLDDNAMTYRVNGQHSKMVVIERAAAGDHRDAFIGSHNLTLHSLTNGWSTTGPADGRVSNEVSVVYRERPSRGPGIAGDPEVSALIDRARQFLDRVWDGALTDEPVPAPSPREAATYLLIGRQLVDAAVRHLGSVTEGGTVELIMYNFGEQEGTPVSCGWVSDDTRCDTLLIDALVGASERGADVRVIVDDRTFQAAINGAAAVARLQAAGVDVRLDPCPGDVGTVCTDEFGAITHTKQLIVNSEAVYIGSHNYYHGSENTGLNGMGETTLRTSAAHILGRATAHFDTLWASTRDVPDAAVCGDHAAIGADVVVTSQYNASRSPENAVDGDCGDDSRWMSAVDDPRPALTIEFDEPTDIDEVDVFSGYGWPVIGPAHVLVDFGIEARGADGDWEQIATFSDNISPQASWSGSIQTDALRIVVDVASMATPTVARVYEVAVRGPGR